MTITAAMEGRADHGAASAGKQHMARRLRRPPRAAHCPMPSFSGSGDRMAAARFAAAAMVPGEQAGPACNAASAAR
ncbi:MAG: hypothetical protein ACLVGA_11635 [Dysosmobacter sp.]